MFSDEALQRAAGYSYARKVSTRRGAQPRRYSLLSELGRVAQPKSDENGELRWTERDVDLLIRAALEVAEKRPSTKDGIAIVRAIRNERKRAP